MARSKTRVAMSRVPTFRALCKEKLAPYPDESGCPFYIDEANDEEEFFTLNHLFKSRTQKNCEAFHRPGLALSLAASSMSTGYKKLLKHTPVEEIECLKKTGLQDLRALLDTEDGKQFLQAVEVLDVGKTQKPSKAKLEKAVGAYVDFQVEHTSELQKTLALRWRRSRQGCIWERCKTWSSCRSSTERRPGRRSSRGISPRS